MPTKAQVRDALTAYVEGWKTGDKEAWLALFADDAAIIDPVGSPPNEGKEAISTFWDRVHSLPMTFEPEVHRMVVCGDEGMLSFTMTTRSESGGGMAMELVDTFLIDDDGRIKLLKAYWDSRCATPVS